MLTADNVSIKASLLLTFQVTRPEVAIQTVESFEQALYAQAQTLFREVIAATTVEELVEKREAIGSGLQAGLAPRAEALGLTLGSVGIKDFIFPPPLRQTFHQVVEAKKAAQASLERARGETATLRHLANAARMLENNPALLALKTLQTAADGRHTLVLGLPGNVVPLPSGPAPETPTPGDESQAA